MNKTNNTIKEGRAFRIALAIIGTVFLGAVGSGLWELFLRDIVLAIGNWTLSSISSMWGGYVDLLHKDIGKHRDDLLTIPILAFVASITLVGPWLAVHHVLRRITRVKRDIEGDEKEEVLLDISDIVLRVMQLRKTVLLVLIPLTVISTINFLIIGWQMAYTRNAGVWADRSIEILAPYILEKERLKLRSLLRSVETADQFYQLESELRELSSRVSVGLPKFTVIRKPE